MFGQQRILVVGSSGYLGRVITRTLASRHFVVPTHNKNPYFPESIQYSFPYDDLRNLMQTKVDICIFAAEIEKNQDCPELEGLDFFRQAVEELVLSLPAVRIVYVSSDGIFDGRKGLYTESDTPEPKTEYGRKLRICEGIIRTHCANYCIVRPSYLYGHALGQLDKRLQRTKHICQSKQVAIFFDDMFKSPLHVVDAARLIGTLALSDHMGIVHIGGRRMSVYEFHKEAMVAMNIVGQILPEPMPVDIDLLPDTSLDVTLCTKLTNFVPQSVTNSLREYPEH